MIIAMSQRAPAPCFRPQVAVLIFAGSLCLPSIAQAGYEEGDEADKAERLASSWRKKGPAALSTVMKALCSDDAWSSGAAESVLIEWGPASVKPLLEAMTREPCHVPAATALSALICRADKAGVRAALHSVLSALAMKKGKLASSAVSAINAVAFEKECPTRGIVFELSAAPAIALLDSATGKDKAELLRMLSNVGPAAAAAVPRATDLLDDPGLRGDAVRLLGAIGPASAPAVPKLRSLLKGEHAGAASVALGEIGPAARSALPDVIALLEDSNRNGCQKPVSVAVLADAIGKLGAAGDLEASSAARALAASLQTCPLFEKPLLEALGTIGSKGAAAAPALLAMMKDESRPLGIRALASRSLLQVGAPLSQEGSALVAALKKKSALVSAPMPDGPQPQIQEPRGEMTPEQRGKVELEFAARHAAHQVNICREEVNLSPVALAGSWKVDNLHRLDACLRERLCGPTRRTYATSMSTCCRAGFGNETPSWCSAN